MVENNRRQQEFIERLLKDSRAPKRGSVVKVPYRQKWKPHDLRPMSRKIRQNLDQAYLNMVAIQITKNPIMIVSYNQKT